MPAEKKQPATRVLAKQASTDVDQAKRTAAPEVITADNLAEPSIGSASPGDLSDVSDIINDIDESDVESIDPDPEALLLGSNVCTPLLSTGFAIMASRRGKHWALSDGEVSALGEALDPVLAKYLPNGAELFTPEISLIITALMIVTPRLQQDAKLAEKLAKQAEAKQVEEEKLAKQVEEEKLAKQVEEEKLAKQAEEEKLAKQAEEEKLI